MPLPFPSRSQNCMIAARAHLYSILSSTHTPVPLRPFGRCTLLCSPIPPLPRRSVGCSASSPALPQLASPPSSPLAVGGSRPPLRLRSLPLVRLPLSLAGEECRESSRDLASAFAAAADPGEMTDWFYGPSSKAYRGSRASLLTH